MARNEMLAQGCGHRDEDARIGLEEGGAVRSCGVRMAGRGCGLGVAGQGPWGRADDIGADRVGAVADMVGRGVEATRSG